MWYQCFFVLEAVAIITGNVTVLVAFTRTPALRKRKHFLLVSLAVADLLVGVISVPYYVTIFFTGFKQTIYSIQDILFAHASVFGLTAVAIERAYAVYFPFKHRTLWKGVYVIGIAMTWMMAAFIACSLVYSDGILWVCAVSVPIVSSLTVVVVSYSLVWIKMTCMTRVGHAIQGRDNKLTVTLLIATVISLIAWIPFQAIMVYGNLCRRKCLTGKYINIVISIAKFLQYGNSLVNPIIYALRMPQFKRAVINTVRCCKRHQLAVQVPNERPGHNCANVIPLTIKYNKAFIDDDFQDLAIRGETQHNPSTSQIPARYMIQNNDSNGQDKSL